MRDNKCLRRVTKHAANRRRIAHFFHWSVMELRVNEPEEDAAVSAADRLNGRCWKNLRYGLIPCRL
jgi:hypothetical protein